jgi:hypothetical protein
MKRKGDYDLSADCRIGRDPFRRTSQSKIYFYPEQIKFGKRVPAKESVPYESKFGIKDRSKCFLTKELKRALTDLPEY